MFNKLTRFAAVAGTIAAATVASVGLGSGGTALAGPPLGTNTLSPQTGTESTQFSLIPPSGASCTGSGSGTPAYRWQTFMVSAAVDASTLTYAAGPNPVSGQFVSPLYDAAGGNPVINKNPSASPLGLISGIPTYSFASIVGASGLVNGAYKIGYACTQAGNLDAGKFWETPITLSNVTPSGFSYSFGAVPAAPVLATPLTPGNSSLAGSFTAAASIPAQSGYTVTAVPTSGPTVTLPVAAPGAFTLTGLQNGVQYGVSVVATNSVGPSAASNTVNGTPTPPVTPAPSPFTATPGIGQVVLNWTPAAVPSGATLVNHIVTVSPSVAGSPFTVPAGTNTLTVSAPAANYTFTIQATYTPSFFTGATASAAGTVLPPTVIYQDITVNRPVGALVLTQVCGNHAAFAATTFEGNPVPSVSAVSNGTAPFLGATSPFGSNLGGATISGGEFAQYPYPTLNASVPGEANATYRTHCGIDLGIGKLITTGSKAGQYFTATGVLNQVTVVDTRDTDPGFTINGTVSDFTNVQTVDQSPVTGGTPGTASFSGSYLGWTPVKTADSSASLAGYNQTVTAGAPVAPSNTGGLKTGATLATATSGAGLGIATLDASLNLLIPLTARNGTYNATLTFTTI